MCVKLWKLDRFNVIFQVDVCRWIAQRNQRFLEEPYKVHETDWSVILGNILFCPAPFINYINFFFYAQIQFPPWDGYILRCDPRVPYTCLCGISRVKSFIIRWITTRHRELEVKDRDFPRVSHDDDWMTMVEVCTCGWDEHITITPMGEFIMETRQWAW